MFVHCTLRNRCTSYINLVQRLPGVRIILLQHGQFFNDEILNDLMRFTNQCIQNVCPNYTRERDACDSSRVEMEAFIGILFMAGGFKSSHQNLYDLRLNDRTEVEFFATK